MAQATQGRARDNYDRTSGAVAVGLAPLDTDRETPPEGWRIDPQSGALVPTKRSNAGKALAAQIADTKVGPPRLPGMPESVFDQAQWFSPGLQMIDGTVYARWRGNCPLAKLMEGDHSWNKKVDLNLWTAAKLSTYYAATEAAEAGTAATS